MKTKKLLALGLAAISTFAMSATAMAADPAPSAVTFEVAEGDTHVYDAYQIFTGDVTTGGSITNMLWGYSGKGKTMGTRVTPTEIAGIEEIGSAPINDKEELAKIEGLVDFSKPAATGIKGADEDTPNGSITITSGVTLSPGYYLIKDKSTFTPTDPDAFTQFIVKASGGKITINRKSTNQTPSIDKQVKSVNGIDAGVNGVDAAESDTVSYSIKVTLPGNIQAYKAYKFVVTDNISEGLTLSAGAPVLTYYKNSSDTGTGVSLATSTSANNVTKNENKTANYFLDTTNGSLAVCSGDIMTLEDVSADSYFVITYSATVNNKAAFENDNTASLSYSNNPNDEDMGTMNTINQPDVAPVYTYTLNITEEDANGAPVENMKVTLYKHNGTSYEKVSEQTSNEDGLVSWPRLDAGQYKLVEDETTVPAGLTKHADTVFTITSDFNATTGEITSLSTNLGAQPDVKENSAKADATTGIVEGTLIHYTSGSLPVTGTIGIVALGGAAVAAIGAAIGMRVKGKKDEDED